MIDISYLNNQPKEFTKETNILKYLFNILNEIKQELLYIKNNSECEFKNFDTPLKNLMNSLKNHKTELNNLILDDYSNILKYFQSFVDVFNKKKSTHENLQNQSRELESKNLNTNLYKIEAIFQQNKNNITVNTQNLNSSLEGENTLNNQNIQEEVKEQNITDMPNNLINLKVENFSIEEISKENILLTTNSPHKNSNPQEINNIHNNTLNTQEDFSNLNQINKIYLEINNQINESLKGSQESISIVIKDLSNQRLKFKNLNIKAEKQMKEIENAILYRKKIETDDKNNYNLSLREKSDDKILNLLNEFEEIKSQILVSFEETKKSETNLNEIIKANFLYNLIINIQGIKKLKICFDETIENKQKFFKTIEEIILNSLDNIEKNENDIPDDCYKIFYESKLIPYLSLESFNIEEIFPKNSPFTVNLINVDSIISFTQGINLLITTRKKNLIYISKITNEISKFIENFIYNSSKSIKSLITPKSNLINSCAFMKQIREFLKSSFELLIRKFEDENKTIINNIISQVDLQIKELSQDEILFKDLFNKIQKELINFKNNLNKIQQNKDKAFSNSEKIKEQIKKTFDDPINTQKLEKQLNSSFAEDENLREQTLDLNRKFKKFIEENFEFLKKNFDLYKDKELNKTKELKESISKTIKQKNKYISHFLQYLQFKTEIVVDSETCISSIEQIYLTFFNEIGINSLGENKFYELVKFLYSKNESKDLSLSSIITDEENIQNLNISVANLAKNMKFLQKDEIIIRKNLLFSSESSIKEDEIKSYYDKLNYLKLNSKKISVKNVLESNRKRYDDIFYYDIDEIVSNSNFSCALSDKILLQGKLYVTNKKLVFYSWFNNLTLFGTTLLEIPKSEILDISKQYNMIFDNSLEIYTKNKSFFVTSLMFRDKCYSVIKELIFGEIEEKDNSPLDKRLSLKINSEKSETENNNNLNNEINLKQNDEQSSIVLIDGNKFEGNPNDIQNIIENLNDSITFVGSNNKNVIDININASGPNYIINNEKNNQKNLYENNFKNEEVITKINETNKIQSISQMETSNLNNLLNSSSNKFSKIEISEENKFNENQGNLTEIKNELLYHNNFPNNQALDNCTEITCELFENHLSQKLNEIHKKNYENFLITNHRNFEYEYVKDLDLGDIPLSYIYNSLYNVDNICEELDYNKNFLLSIMEERKDYNIVINKLPEVNKDFKVPKFFCDRNEIFEFSKTVENLENNLKEFSEEKLNKINFKIDYVHPILKKRFMGPSKLNIEDNFKVYFISPKCFIVENTSYLSGFMMMDTFFTVMQYKYETDYFYSKIGDYPILKNKSKLSVKFGFEFVKSTMFKSKIQENGKIDNEEFIKIIQIPMIEKVLLNQKKIYELEQNKKNIKNNLEIKSLAVEIESNSNVNEECKVDNILVNSILDKQEEKLKIKDEIIQEFIEEEKFVKIKKKNLEKENLNFTRKSFYLEYIDKNCVNIFIVFGLLMLIIGRLDMLNPVYFFIFINILGFVIIFEKLKRIENRLK